MASDPAEIARGLTREDFATDAERAEYDALVREAMALDVRRQAITARLNILRQRFAQRRLAAARGQPFRRVLRGKHHAALAAMEGGDAR